MKKTILITGAAGFIGFHLSKGVIEKSYDVVGLDNINDYYEVTLKHDRIKILEKYTNFIFEKVDISNKVMLLAVFKKYHIDVVINLAAQAGVRYSISHPESYIQSNLVGFANLMECCRLYNIGHFIFASSSSIYGNNNKVPFSVDDKTDEPISLYAATKKSNELIAYAYSHLYQIPCTGLRFFTVYGPYGRPDMAYFSFTRDIIAGTPIKVFNQGDLYRDFTYIDDIVIGIEKLIDGSRALKKQDMKFQIYNIGNHSPEKLLDFIEYLEDFIGKKAIKEFYPMQLGDVYRTYADVSDLERDVAFRPNTSLKDGLQKFVEWYKWYYKV